MLGRLIWPHAPCVRVCVCACVRARAAEMIVDDECERDSTQGVHSILGPRLETHQLLQRIYTLNLRYTI